MCQPMWLVKLIFNSYSLFSFFLFAAILWWIKITDLILKMPIRSNFWELRRVKLATRWQQREAVGPWLCLRVEVCSSRPEYNARKMFLNCVGYTVIDTRCIIRGRQRATYPSRPRWGAQSGDEALGLNSIASISWGFVADLLSYKLNRSDGVWALMPRRNSWKTRLNYFGLYLRDCGLFFGLHTL